MAVNPIGYQSPDFDTGGGSPSEDDFLQNLIGGTQPEEEPDYTVGGDNLVYWENVEFNPTDILSNLQAQIYAGLSVRGLQFGWTRSTVNQFMEGNWGTAAFGGFLDGIWSEANETQNEWSRISSRFAPEVRGEGSLKAQMGAHYYTQTQQGFMELTTRVWDWFNQRSGVDLGAYPTAEVRGGGRGGGGGGRRGPTDQEIRNKFDLDELSEAASNIWRGMLLTDDADTRGMAKAYVDAIVAARGEKKIDFTEFIRKRAKQTDRYASIYSNKPDAMSEEAYLAPYYQSAMQVLSPGQAANVAIGGAQFGADPRTFAERLRRSEAATGSAPYINELQERLGSLNRLFRG